MVNILIYGGLGLILVAVVLALIAAIIGCQMQGWKFTGMMWTRRFIDPSIKMPRSMKMLLRWAVIILLIGAIILCIGIYFGLK